MDLPDTLMTPYHHSHLPHYYLAAKALDLELLATSEFGDENIVIDGTRRLRISRACAQRRFHQDMPSYIILVSLLLLSVEGHPLEVAAIYRH